VSIDADRIRTTHVGSLPRPTDLLDLMRARAEGAGVDEAKIDDRVRTAVNEIVAQQRGLGIDLGGSGCLDLGAPTDAVRSRHQAAGQALSRAIYRAHEDVDGFVCTHRG